MAGEIEGLRELERKIQRLGDFPKEMRTELRDSNKRIGRIGAKVVKNSLPRQNREFVVYKKRRNGIERDGKGQIDKVIPPNTLKRSIKAWNMRGSKINVNMGVKVGGSVRFDGYFAQWVEAGNVGKRRRTVGSRFYKSITPRLAQVQGRMQRIQLVAYRRIFNKFAKRLQ